MAAEPVEEDSEEDEEESEDEDDVLSPRWRTVHNSNSLIYPEWQGSLPTSDNVLPPIEYFRMFFTDDILEVIVEQSNLYAMQCDANKPLNLSTKELEHLLLAYSHSM